MNRNRFNKGMTSINALISTTVETYFDKLKSLCSVFQTRTVSVRVWTKILTLYISKMAIDFGQFLCWLFWKSILIRNNSFPCPDDVSRSQTPYPEVFFQETWLMWSSLEQIWPLSWWEMILGSICSIGSH